MLEKKNRIRHDKEFDRVFKTGQSFYGKVLGLKTAANSLEYNRFGILVSLKVSKKAVIRNKIKRQIRSIISKEMTNMRGGKDIVIVVFSLILDKTFAEIKTTLQTGFTRANLYK
ncbi:MAG: ribonuclease P protein component [Patescibacteria group bacterium]